MAMRAAESSARQLADACAHAANLAGALAERDQELEQARAEAAASASAASAAKEELAAAQAAHAAKLAAALAERDRELEMARAEAAAHRCAAADGREELAAVQAAHAKARGDADSAARELKQAQGEAGALWVWRPLRQRTQRHLQMQGAMPTGWPRSCNGRGARQPS